MNILFFLPDQHRFDWVPWNERLPLHLPHLAGLAARGVRFTRAVTPSPLCAPARACLASGRGYERCGVPGNGADYPLQQPTYYQRLRDVGYRVAGVGKFDLHKATLDWGLDGGRLLPEWGFTEGIDNEGKWDAIRSGADTPAGPYMAFLHREGLAQTHVADFQRRRGGHLGYTATHPTPLPDWAYCDTWIAEHGLRLLERFPTGQPWHLQVNFTGPHDPMDATAAMHAGWEGVDFPPPVDNDQLDRATHARIRRTYAAMLDHIDRQIGRFLAAVAARGELEQTLVVYSSDHGEMLGDHNRWAKGTHYRPAVGVPLIVAGPGVRPGAASEALVALHDLAPTFLAAAGAAPLPDLGDPQDGRSLWPLLRDETVPGEPNRSEAVRGETIGGEPVSRAGNAPAAREVVCSGLRGWRLATDGRYTLVRGAPDGSADPLLFDLDADPYERDNVAPAHPADVQRLSAHLSVPLASARS